MLFLKYLNIKKIFLYTLLFNITISTLYADIYLTKNEKDYLKDKKIISMCIDPNWMPYEEFDTNHHHIGMTADYFKIFQKEIHTKIKVILTHNWNESLQFAKNRKCDILSLAMQTPQRKKYLNFTTPYLRIPLVLTTKLDVPFINEISAIGNKTIGIPSGYAFKELLKEKYKNLHIIEVKDITEGLKKVNNGTLFGYIGTLSSVNYMFQNGSSGDLKISGKFPEKWELGIGVRNDDMILLNIFQKAINNLSARQQKKILDDWVSIKVDKKINYILIFEILFLVLLIILFVFYRQNILKKTNNELENKVDEKIKELNELNKNLEKTILQRTRELENKTEYLNRFYNNNGIGILLVDENRIVKDINEKLAQMWGYTREEMMGRNAQFFHISEESYKKFGEIAFTLARANKKIDIAYQFKRKDGKFFWAKFSGEPMNTNDVLWIITDIDQLKNKEKYLLEAKQKAEESTRLKSEFLSNMSHEIRTPMNGIIGMTRLALKTSLDQKQKHYLEQIDNSATSLLNIINDILDFSKIEAGKLEIHKIDFNMKELLNNLQEITSLKAYEKGLSFEIVYDDKLNPIYFGDKFRIRQVLLNLISNAIKFTEKGFVKIIVNQKTNNLVMFQIIDSGIGISKEQQSKLFQSFSQADGSTTRKYGGTGLGLSISKQLVELMGGTIWIKSEQNIGSKFIFEIELKEGTITKEENKDYKNINITTLRNSNILLVEDNSINQEIIIGLLEESQINIDIACNGKEALKKFNANPKKYELILMDVQMPFMDGFETTQYIRKKDKDIPIVALTANAMREDVNETKRAGMNEHLSKPINIEKLYTVLLKYISKKVPVPTNKSKNKEDINIPDFIHINTTIGLSHMANNKKLYMKILHDFYTSYSTLELKKLNNKELQITLHTIKGLSANIGAIKLSAIAQELEKTLHKKLFYDFHKQLSNVLEELKNITYYTKTKTLLPLDTNKKNKLFSTLKEYAHKRRGRECKKVLQEFKTYSLTQENKLLLDKIDLYLNTRNYKNIVEILNEQ